MGVIQEEKRISKSDEGGEPHRVHTFSNLKEKVWLSGPPEKSTNLTAAAARFQGHFALSKSCNVHTPTRQLCGSSALILRLFEAFPRCNY